MQLTNLTAPFPYYGGKGRWASRVLPRLGNPADFPKMVYSEPFSGSLAILLRNPTPFGREIICDKNSLVSNFWRSMQACACQVAGYADYPTYHDDLTARHRWLIHWAMTHSDQVRDDPDFHCPKAAGWWAWGQSNWIGGGFCDYEKLGNQQIPHFNPGAGGKGVQAQRSEIPDPGDTRPKLYMPGYGQGCQVWRNPPDAGDGKIPWFNSIRGGRGVNVQRETLPAVDGRRPCLGGNYGVACGKGCQVTRSNLPVSDKRPIVYELGAGRGVQVGRTFKRPGFYSQDAEQTEQTIGNGERLLPWFQAMQQRLAKVAVLNRDWESAVTPAVLMQHATGLRGVRVILDPPYRTDTGRHEGLYLFEEASTDVAVATYQWALEHGEKYGIVYFCHRGDFPCPEGWEMDALSLRSTASHEPEVAFYSPGLKQPENASKQQSLF